MADAGTANERDDDGNERIEDDIGGTARGGVMVTGAIEL